MTYNIGEFNITEVTISGMAGEPMDILTIRLDKPGHQMHGQEVDSEFLAEYGGKAAGEVLQLIKETQDSNHTSAINWVI